jgi:uncharacterized surface protein with fasciclin (FAS1) repeats
LYLGGGLPASLTAGSTSRLLNWIYGVEKINLQHPHESVSRRLAFSECSKKIPKEREDIVMKKHFGVILASAVVFSGLAAQAQMDPNVGGAAMYPTKNIVENAVNSSDHTTLVAAVKAAGLVDTLEGAGPFTVFAPTNEAFNKLPAGTVDMLLKPENKDQLVKILTYHVVAGRLTTRDLRRQIKMGGGKAMLKTVSGGMLIVTTHDGKIVLTDEKGGMSTITIADVIQSNGVIQVVDSVLLPN